MALDLDALEAMFSDPDAWAPDDITVGGLALIERVRRAESDLAHLREWTGTGPNVEHKETS